VLSRREAFANIRNFTPDGLKAAKVNATIAVKKCDGRDVCKKAGTVKITAHWTGKENQKPRKDPEDGSRTKDAAVKGTVDGNNPGKVNFATLTET
jgi:hypothetical protein